MPVFVCTLYKSGPVTFVTLTGIHFVLWRFFAKCLSPISNLQGTLFLINLSCFSDTLHEVSGCSKSNEVRSHLPINSSKGETPVVVGGVTQYFNKNRANQSYMGPSNFKTDT